MKRALATFILLCAAFAQAFAQTTGVPYFPQTLPGQTVVGRLSANPGATEAIPFARLNAVIANRSGIIYAVDHGVVCDGTTDTSSAMQKAFTAAANKTLILPYGVCILTTTITSLSPITVLGQGGISGPGNVGSLSGTQIVSYDTFLTGDIFQCTTNYSCQFRHFQMNARVARTGGAAIHISGPTGSTNAYSDIYDVTFANQYVGIQLTRPNLVEVHHTYHTSFARAALYTETSSGIEPSGGKIHSNYVFGPSTGTIPLSCLEFHSGYEDVYGNHVLGCQIGINVVIDQYAGGAVKIHDNVIENNTVKGISIANGSGFTASMVMIENNELSNVAHVAAFQASISVNAGNAGAYLTDVHITGNVTRTTFSTVSSVCINLQSGTNAKITGNTCEDLSGSTVGLGIVVGSEAAAPVLVADNTFYGWTASLKYSLTSAVVLRDTIGLAFANLPTVANGSQVYVTDGTTNTAPLTSGGSGTMAFYDNGAWYARAGRSGAALSVLGVTGNATASLADIAAGSDGNVLRRNGTSLGFGAIALGSSNAVTGTLLAANGGTGFAGYAVGDVLYADTTTSLAKLADVATGNALISGGVTTAPSWGKIALTTHVSGVLPVANGGTNCSSATITCFNNITGFSAAGTTGTTSTNLVFSTSPTFVTPVLGAATHTSLTGPLLIGGSSTTQTLTYKTTTGVGAAGADHIFVVGNNGATEAMRILNSGNVGIGISPSARLHVSIADGVSNTMILGGTTKGFRVTTDATASYIDGTDQTGAGSYQPLGVGGSDLRIRISGTEAHRFHASGGLSINNTSDPGAGLIYTNSASFMNRTKTTWSTGAAAQTGTLTNAPAAGNPTKWIPVDDNGTTRYIPAW